MSEIIFPFKEKYISISNMEFLTLINEDFLKIKLSLNVLLVFSIKFIMIKKSLSFKLFLIYYIIIIPYNINKICI